MEDTKQRTSCLPKSKEGAEVGCTHSWLRSKENYQTEDDGEDNLSKDDRKFTKEEQRE